MYLIYVFIILITSLADGAKILGFFPIPSISHQVAFRPLTQELARRGHEVTVLTTDPVFPKGQAPANLTEIDVHDITYGLWRKTFHKTTTGKQNDLFDQFKVVMSLLTDVFELQVNVKEVQDILNNKFDLLLIEMSVRPAWALTHVLKTPAIFVSSFGGMFGVYESLGAPDHPILYPSTIRQKLYNLSFWEKLSELYNHYYFESIFESSVAKDNAVLKNLFGPEVPPVQELIKNMDMLFLNVHPMWEENRPVPPNVLFMGGVHQKPQKELPKVNIFDIFY